MLKKIFTVLGAVVSVFVALFGALFAIAGLPEGEVALVIFGVAILAIGVCFFIVCFKKSSGYSKLSEKPQEISERLSEDVPTKEKPKTMLTRKEMQKNLFRRRKYKFIHAGGLPVMEGARCDLVSNNESIVIKSQGVTFELNKSKITDISIQKNVNEYAQAVSSSGGALAGAMAFGVLGAAIGGRTKSRRFKDIRKYLVIAYFDSNDSPKFIIFNQNFKSQLFVNDFKIFSAQNAVKKTITLD